MTLAQCAASRFPNDSCHGDDDFASSVACPDVTRGIGDRVQRLLAIDHRGQLSGVDELLQRDYVLILHLCYVHD